MLNCFHPYTRMKKLKKHGKTFRNHDFCHMIMPIESNKILKRNPGEKSLKVPFIIYADLECSLQKMNACQVNPTKSYTEKKAEHESSGYSQVKCCSFDKSKNKCIYYRGQDKKKKKSHMKNNNKFVIYVKKNFSHIKIKKN